MVVSSLLVAYSLHHFAPALQAQEYSVPAVTVAAEQSIGSLTVTSSGAERTRTIPPGAQHVPMLHLYMQASCDSAVTLEALNLQRRGLGDRRDIQSLYAVSGYQRLTRLRGVTSKDGSVQLRFRRLTIPPCQTLDVQILADFQPDSAVSGQHALVLRSVETDAVVRFQEDATIAPVRTAGITQGTIRATMLPLHGRVRVGGRRIVARLQLRAEGQGNHMVSAIRFTNAGSARNADLQNLYIQSGYRSSVFTVVPSMIGDTVTVPIQPPLQLSRGQSRIVTLRADVASGARRTLRFILEEPSDIVSTYSRRRLP